MADGAVVVVDEAGTEEWASRFIPKASENKFPPSTGARDTVPQFWEKWALEILMLLGTEGSDNKRT